MEVKMLSLDGKASGSVKLPESIFGLEPRADLIQRCVNWQLAKRQRGTHRIKLKSEISRTGKKMYAQKGTGGARHGSARVGVFRGGAKIFGPVVRSHAIDLPKKVRALALRHALSAKAKDGGIIVIDKASVKDGKTKALAANFEKLGLKGALIVDGAEIEANFRSAARNIPNIDVLPIQGINVYDIMRRGKLVLTKAAIDALEARFEMSKAPIGDPRHYDVIVSPVITEKATVASEHNKVVFKVARTATKPQIKAAVEKLFDVKVKSVNTLNRKGKMKVFKGMRGQQQGTKRAVVTLEEGHRIDVTTGL